jgi:prenyltransferase beta subunit
MIAAVEAKVLVVQERVLQVAVDYASHQQVGMRNKPESPKDVYHLLQCSRNSGHADNVHRTRTETTIVSMIL